MGYKNRKSPLLKLLSNIPQEKWTLIVQLKTYKFINIINKKGVFCLRVQTTNTHHQATQLQT